MFYRIVERGDGLVDVWLTPGQAYPDTENTAGRMEYKIQALAVQGINPADPVWRGDLGALQLVDCQRGRGGDSVTVVAIVGIILIIGMVVLVYAVVASTPPMSLDEQEECIRANLEEREAKKRMRQEKRRRKKT